jgi:phospholipid/cholesterol/gamma-HCH transport system substrate-binding protein
MAVRASRIVRVVVITLLAIGTSVFLYLLINNFQFFRGPSIRIHFASIGDLNVGAWVRRAGMKIGSITRLEPAPDEKTIIATVTLRPGQSARRDDRFALISKGILGDMLIELTPGPKESPVVEDGHLFEGAPAFSLSDILGGGAMGTVTDLVASIKGITDVLRRNEGSIDNSIRDIEKSAANVRAITESAARIAVAVPDATARISASITRLEQTVNAAADTTEKLLKKVEGSLTSGSEDLASSLASLRRASADIQSAVAKLTAQQSVIGTLESAETSRSITTAVANLEEVSKSLLRVSADAEKVAAGLREIFETK